MIIFFNLTLFFSSEMDVSSLLTMHNAAIQSIRTLRCDMEVEEQSNRFSLKGTGTYFRSSSSARAIENHLVPGRIIDSITVNGITKKIMTYKGKSTAAVYDSRLSLLNDCDAWFYALFIVRRPGKLEPISLDELVKEAQKATVRESSDEDNKIMILDMDYSDPKNANDRWKINIEFNSVKNYMIKNIKYVSVSASCPGCMLHYNIPSFMEVAPGVYFPQKFVYEFSNNGKVTVKKTVQFKNVQCNKALGANDLALRYPSGIKVRDAIRGTYYQVNETGSIISKETPINYNSKPLETSDINVKPSDSTPKNVVYDTSAEPQGWPWIVYVLLGVVAISIGYFVYIFLANRLSASRS